MSNDATCFGCDARLSECDCGDTHTYDSLYGTICPYCGYKNVACDSDGLLYNESTTEYDCGECSKPFNVDVSISFSWTAHRT